MRALAKTSIGQLLPWLLLLLIAASGVTGFMAYRHGVEVSDLRHQAANGKAVADEHARYVEAVQIGNKAASALADQLRRSESTRAALSRRLRDAPTLVSTAQCPQPAGVDLTLAAVRLYNAAATGADVPAGACGAAGAPDAACAAGAGIPVGQAWRDTALPNVARHRDCDTRLNALIDEIERRQAAANKP